MEAPQRRRPPRPALGIAAGIASAVLAVVWLFVVPGQAAETSGLESAVIRWAHPLCWVLLSLAAFAFALRWPRALRSVLLVGAGICYAAFLIALF